MDLIVGEAELRFGVRQRDAIGFGIEVEERLFFFDLGVRFGCDGNDLTRDLRTDRGTHCLNVRVLLRDIAARREVKAQSSEDERERAQKQQRPPPAPLLRACPAPLLRRIRRFGCCWTCLGWTPWRHGRRLRVGARNTRFVAARNRPEAIISH
jgi:hypothetical protein